MAFPIMKSLYAFYIFTWWLWLTLMIIWHEGIEKTICSWMSVEIIHRRWHFVIHLQWISYQIRKVAGCACTGNATGVFPATDFKGNCQLATSTCTTARVSHTCRDACRDHQPAVAGKTFPALPAHAQSAILHIWQEAHCHSDILMFCYTGTHRQKYLQ